MDRTGFEQWKSKEVARLLALVETERRYYQEMVAELPAPVVVLGANQTPVYANRAFRRNFSVRGEELRCKTISQLIPSEEWQARIAAAHEQGTALEPFFITAAGRTLRIAIVPMRNWDDESGLETLLLIHDVTGLALPAVEPEPQPETPPAAPLAPPPVQYPALLWQADPGTLNFTAVQGEDPLGYEAGHWTTELPFFSERIHPEDRTAVLDLYAAAIRAQGDASAEFRAKAASGAWIWCRETIRAREGVVTGIFTDISKRKELEYQTLAAARQDALLQLAGRLAHDLNNPLMIAQGYGEELLESIDPSSPISADAAQILAATRRISEIAGHLTSFSRRQAVTPSSLNLNALFGLAAATIAQTAGPGVVVEMTESPEAVWAAADRDQLTDVILALTAGAHQAAQDRTRLTISWSAAEVTERVSPGTLPPGKYARIAFRDDGRGLEPGSLWTLFEGVLPPKDPSGISPALARAYGIVREWGGDIAVTNIPPHGTEYAVYLPLAEPGAAAAPEPTPEVPAEPPRETILVVDDETGIRGLVRKILRRERYVVLDAATAEEALGIAAGHADTIHLLLTDVILPGMQGPELAQRMVTERPGLKVLYISGYTDDERVRAGQYPPGAHFLAKPFTLSALLHSVREALEG